MLDNALDFLNGKTVAIDLLFGVDQYNEYMHKIDLVKAGFSMREVFAIRPAHIGFSVEDIKAGTFYNVNPESYEDFKKSITSESIVNLDLKGFMSVEDGMYNHGASSYYKLIDQLSTNKNVKAINLRVKSGGGEAMAGMIWNTAIKEFVSSGKPFSAEVTEAGSSAYLAILPSSIINAINDMVMVGSIGAVMSIDKRTIDFIKNNTADIYSRKSNKKNKEVRALINGDDEPMKDRLDQFVTTFQNLVYENRPIKGNVNDIMEGDMVFAAEAISTGLIDGVKSSSEIKKTLKKYLNN